MSSLSTIGSLMHLYLDQIEPDEPIEIEEFILQGSASLLNDKGGRNWIPVVVEEIGPDRYRVVGNSFVYAIAETAGLERVWCIVAPGNEDTTAITKVLAREQLPKINLSTASYDEIKMAIDYLTKDPKIKLKLTDIPKAIDAIEAAPERPYWTTLDPLTTLKCSITAAKLKAFAQVFYLSPQPLPKPPEIEELKKMSATALKALAKKRGLTGYTQLKKDQLIAAILDS